MNVRINGDIKKFEGVLLGAALGDALGWPHEDRARNSSNERGLFLEDWKKRSGGRFQPHEEEIQAGSYSDDTQLTIAVARSRLLSATWWQHLAKVELPFWPLYQRGAGGASLRAARLLQTNTLPWESNSTDRAKYFAAGGNGAAMRVAAHSLLGVKEEVFSSVAVNVLADSVLTHGHPVALIGALAYAYALWTALRRTGTLEYGQLLDDVRASSDDWSQLPPVEVIWPSWRSAVDNNQFRIQWSKTVADFRRQLDVAAEGLARGALDFDEEVLRSVGCYDKRISGAGTVAAAASIFLASKYAVSPMEGVARAALAKGTDTDTIASMTGGLLGAISGPDCFLPLVRRVQDHDFLVDLARGLHFGRHGEVSSGSSSNPDFGSLLNALNAGTKDIVLPFGSRAKVLGVGGVVAKSEKLLISSWKVEDEHHQTFFIKQLLKRAVTRPLEQPSQKGLDLGDAAAPSGRFAGISLFTRNLDESRYFYNRLLGLSITKDTGDLVNFGSHLVLRKNNRVASIGEGTIIYVDVDDVQNCWRSLQRISYAYATEIAKGARRPSFKCRDPDGRTVEVFQR